MTYRYTWLVASATSVLGFAMLHRLMKPSANGLPWQVLVTAGLLLGVAVSCIGAVYRLRGRITSLVHVGLMSIVVMRLGAPETLRFGVVPTIGGQGTGHCGVTRSTAEVLGCHLSEAVRLIHNGVDSVLPLTGIVIVVTLLFWAVGALVGWGLSTGRPFLGVVPPFVLTLQMATIGRQSTHPVHLVAFVLLAVAGMAAVARDEDRQIGRLRHSVDVSTRRRVLTSSNGVLGLTAAASLLAVVMLTPVVPPDGLLQWSNPTLLTGSYTGSVSFSPFVTIQQRLVEPHGLPLFTARIEGDTPASQVYFRLFTMDSYASNGRFFVDDPVVVSVGMAATATEARWEHDDNEFFGPTADVTTRITIEALSEDWVPAAYAPRAVEGPDLLVANLQARPDDASLHLDGSFTRRGLQYSVRSRIPQPDVTALISTAQGELSSVFANARLQGEPVPPPRIPQWNAEPATVDRYLALPDADTDNRLDEIGALAADLTLGLQTPFEMALALEKWFHSPLENEAESTTGFAYTTDIAPGQGASDLAAWLLDPDSPNFHQGYCENFATAMGVLARTLDIPSRVVLGFTPGVLSPDDPSTVIVTDANAHAWVELWMPSQGWVRFDPTPRGQGDTPQTFEDLEARLRFPLDEYLTNEEPTDPRRPGVIDTTTTETQGDEGTAPPPNVEEVASEDRPDRSWRGGLVRALWVSAAVVLLLGAIPSVKWSRRRKRLRRLREGDISAAWEQLVSRLADLDQPANPAATPSEVADAFDQIVMPLADVYELSLYGPHDSVGDEHVATALMTLERTETLIVARYSRRERLRAVYRPHTIVPKAWTRSATTARRRD